MRLETAFGNISGKDNIALRLVDSPWGTNPQLSHLKAVVVAMLLAMPDKEFIETARLLGHEVTQ